MLGWYVTPTYSLGFSLILLLRTDKYADKSKHALVPFQHENTVSKL
jgi:hypothetical protein